MFLGLLLQACVGCLRRMLATILVKIIQKRCKFTGLRKVLFSISMSNTRCVLRYHFLEFSPLPSDSLIFAISESTRRHPQNAKTKLLLESGAKTAFQETQQTTTMFCKMLLKPYVFDVFGLVFADVFRLLASHVANEFRQNLTKTL